MRERERGREGGRERERERMSTGNSPLTRMTGLSKQSGPLRPSEKINSEKEREGGRVCEIEGVKEIEANGKISKERECVCVKKVIEKRKKEKKCTKTNGVLCIAHTFLSAHTPAHTHPFTSFPRLLLSPSLFPTHIFQFGEKRECECEREQDRGCVLVAVRNPSSLALSPALLSLSPALLTHSP